MSNEFNTFRDRVELTVRDLMTLPNIPNLYLVAGELGLDKKVRNTTVYEVEDAYRWLRPNDFLVTSFKSVPPIRYDEIFEKLSQMDVSGIVICYTNIYYDGMPEKIIDLANQYSIPLFTADEDVRYEDIMLSIMHGLIDSETNQLYLRILVMNEINKLIIEGTTFKNFISLLNNFISQNVVLLDKNYEIIALDVGSEYENDVLIKSLNEAIRDYTKASKNKALDIEPSNFCFGEFNYSSYPVISNQLIFGYLIVISDALCLPEKSKLIIEQCIEGLANLFKKQYAEMEFQHNLKKEVFDLLSKPQFNTTEQNTVTDYLTLLGLEHSSDLRFISILIEPLPSMSNDNSNWKRLYLKINELFNYFYKSGICYAHEDGFILLIPCVQDQVFIEILTEFISHFDYIHNCSQVIVGSKIENISEINISYHMIKKAHKSIPIELTVKKGKILMLEDFEALVHLFDFINYDSMHGINLWAQRLLNPLRDSDEDKKMDLLNNLKYLLLNDLSVKEVADQLNIHKNTLQYRMNIIKNILNTDPFHEQRFEYTLAIYIDMISNKR